MVRLIFKSMIDDKQVAALRGYKNGNSIAMALWENIYSSHAPLIALTDTFSTECFFDVLILIIVAICLLIVFVPRSWQRNLIVCKGGMDCVKILATLPCSDQELKDSMNRSILIRPKRLLFIRTLWMSIKFCS